MNDLMSFGLHRWWKRYTVHLSGVRPGDSVLDLATGTGDLARLYRQRVGDKGTVVACDINAAMLELGRSRLLDSGLIGNPRFVQCDAEVLPFQDHSFDCVNIAFGLRNMTHKEAALASMLGTLKFGGSVVILEFSRLVLPALSRLYDAYSLRFIPALGHMVAGDRDSYRYLVESIRVHPDQEALKAMMERAGFERVRYWNLAGGIVAVHRGYRL
jgi:demethylmenaquinone methyltransferase/2-methoxy-6-polyprenyl-1,4-benzoquinol methylase